MRGSVYRTLLWNYNAGYCIKKRTKWFHGHAFPPTTSSFFSLSKSVKKIVQIPWASQLQCQNRYPNSILPRKKWKTFSDFWSSREDIKNKNSPWISPPGDRAFKGAFEFWNNHHYPEKRIPVRVIGKIEKCARRTILLDTVVVMYSSTLKRKLMHPCPHTCEASQSLADIRWRIFPHFLAGMSCTIIP